MLTAIISLSIACTLLTLVVGVLASTIPWLWWKSFRLEQDYKQELQKYKDESDGKIQALDDVVSSMLEAAGISPSSNGDGTGPNGGRLVHRG